MNPSKLEIGQPSQILPELDLVLPSVPARSELINLDPVLLDSGGGESLWSYLQRLSEAHSVRLFDLVRYYFKAFTSELLGRPKSSRATRSGDWHYLINAANGPTAGRRIASLMRRLTGRDDLESLTLAPVCRTAGLTVNLRARQAWCPDCLQGDEKPFERLSWAIAGVTHCSRHKAPLQDHCAGCGKPQLRFAAQSDVARCMHCGHPKHARLDNPAAMPDDFSSWCSGQVEKLLAAAARGALVTTSSDIRAHNLRVSASLPGIGGITGLSSKLVVGRNTAWCWLREDRDMPLFAALKWAWVVRVDLPQLFSRKLTSDELVFTPLPGSIKERSKKARNASVPHDSTLLYRAALNLAANNPFIAPRRDKLVKQSGVHHKHPAFKEPQFVRLIHRLRSHERKFLHKERVWREVIDVHNAALKVIARGDHLTRRRVGNEMAKPGCFCGPLARAYLKWLKKRTRNAQSLLGPKHVPIDVRAYWDLVHQSNTTKGG